MDEQVHEIVFADLPAAQKERFYQILCKNNYSFRYEYQKFIAEFQLSAECKAKAPKLAATGAYTGDSVGKKTQPQSVDSLQAKKLSMSQLVYNEPELRLTEFRDNLSPIEPEKSYIKPTKPVRRAEDTGGKDYHARSPESPFSQVHKFEPPPKQTELLISNVNERSQVGKPPMAKSSVETEKDGTCDGDNARRFTRQRMATVFPQIHRIFPEIYTYSTLQPSTVRYTSQSFIYFVSQAYEVSLKQPQFCQARFNVTAKTLQKALQHPYSIFCIFVTNDQLESASVFAQSERIWAYLEHIYRSQDQVNQSVYYFLSKDAAAGFLTFSDIVSECIRQANKGILAKATFLKITKDNLKQMQDFVQFAGKNYVLDYFVSLEQVSEVVCQYFRGGNGDLLGQIQRQKAAVYEVKMQESTAPAQLRLPYFYIKAFNQNLMVDQAQFMPLCESMLLILPAVIRQYSETLLASVVQIPQIYLLKLRTAICYAIAGRMDDIGERMSRFGSRSVTVGESYQFCVELVYDVQEVACETAESILISYGRVNM